MPEMDLRKIDALVAEKVMELEVIENVEGYWYCPQCQEWVHGQQVTFQEVHVRCGAQVANDWPCDSDGNVHPRYSSDIAAAWRGVEVLRARGIYIDVRTTADFYEVTAMSHDGELLASAADPSLPKALCRVLLEAVGVEVPQHE